MPMLDDPNPAIDLLSDYHEERYMRFPSYPMKESEERKEIVQSIYEEVKTMDPKKEPGQPRRLESCLGNVAGRFSVEAPGGIVPLL